MLDVAVKLIEEHDTSWATLHVACVMVGSVKMRRVVERRRSCDNIIVIVIVVFIYDAQFEDDLQLVFESFHI